MSIRQIPCTHYNTTNTKMLHQKSNRIIINDVQYSSHKDPISIHTHTGQLFNRLTHGTAMTVV